MPAPYVSVLAAVAGLVSFRYLFRRATALVVNLVGFVYPAYESLKVGSEAPTRRTRILPR